MVGQEPGQFPVHLPGHPLDVTSDRLVRSLPLGPGKRRVADVADQDVPEAELDVSPHPACGLPADELLGLQGIQHLVEPTRAPEGPEGSTPERPPHY